MKTNNLFKVLALAAVTIGGVACNDAKDGIIDNRVYIGEASTGKTKTIYITNSTMTTSMTVRLVQAIDHDVTVKIALDPTLIDEYNAMNETEFQMINPSLVSFTEEVVIPAGAVSAPPTEIIIQSFDPNGASYAIPFTLTSSTGAQLAQKSSNFIFTLEKELNQWVPMFKNHQAVRALPDTSSWNLDLPNYTLEWWSRIDAFTVNNQAIIDSGSDGDDGGTEPGQEKTELYIRYGDLIYASGGRYVYDFLQIKTMGSQFDTGDPTVNPLEANTWYHFAITYDAATGTSLLYKNGEQVASLSTEAGKPMHIGRFRLFSCTDGVEMAQIRMWSVTRSKAQIQKYMKSEVAKNDPNLIVYLPMDDNNTETTGGGRVTFNDVTGNGHNVTATVTSWSQWNFSN